MAPHRPTHARSPPHRAERSAELQVVFDEYHFGKFVNGYITGEYFFDIHPPLGKLLLCLVARMGGYDGSQSWDKIGVDIPPEVNLLGLRGALTRTRTRTLALTLTLTWLNAWRPAARTSESSSCRARRWSSGRSTRSQPRGSASAAGAGSGSAPGWGWG